MNDLPWIEVNNSEPSILHWHAYIMVSSALMFENPRFNLKCVLIFDYGSYPQVERIALLTNCLVSLLITGSEIHNISNLNPVVPNNLFKLLKATEFHSNHEMWILHVKFFLKPRVFWFTWTYIFLICWKRWIQTWARFTKVRLRFFFFMNMTSYSKSFISWMCNHLRPIHIIIALIYVLFLIAKAIF